MFVYLLDKQWTRIYILIYAFTQRKNNFFSGYNFDSLNRNLNYPSLGMNPHLTVAPLDFKLVTFCMGVPQLILTKDIYLYMSTLYTIIKISWFHSIKGRQISYVIHKISWRALTYVWFSEDIGQCFALGIISPELWYLLIIYLLMKKYSFNPMFS